MCAVSKGDALSSSNEVSLNGAIQHIHTLHGGTATQYKKEPAWGPACVERGEGGKNCAFRRGGDGWGQLLVLHQTA